MGKNVQLKTDNGDNIYPRTLAENVYITKDETLEQRIATMNNTVSGDNGCVNNFYVNDYSGADIEKIRSAINACNEAGGGNVIFDGVYEVNDTIEVYMDKLNLISYTSAIIKLNTDAEDTILFRIYSEAVASGADATCHVIQGLKLEAVNSRKGIGIVLGADSGGSQTSRDIKMRDMVITNFNIGIDYRKNAYLISFADGALSSCNICTRMNNGYSNYGERIVFTNTTLCNSTQLVLMRNGEGVMYFQNCSFDYSTKFIEVRSGNVYVNGSHLEFRHPTTEQDWLIYCGGTSGHGSIVIRDSAFVCTNPDSKMYRYLFWCDGGSIWTDARFSIEVDSCRMIHWSTTSGFLCGGNDNGIFDIHNTKMNQIHSNTPLTKPSMSVGQKIKLDSISTESKTVDGTPQQVATATVEIVDETLEDGRVVKAAKVTKTTWLGYACTVKLSIPNVFGQHFASVGIKRVGNGGSSVWVTATDRYNNFVSRDSIEVKPTSADNTTYTKYGLVGYHFQTQYSVDDYTISFNLSNADQNEVFYVYADIYQF